MNIIQKLGASQVRHHLHLVKANNAPALQGGGLEVILDSRPPPAQA